ncbi:unnamed protein product [Amoebophrya sp. A25]|nr:unnamed protein product [Amoebophrya sp. A25]|eukprot:GSA25T00020885001.1
MGALIMPPPGVPAPPGVAPPAGQQAAAGNKPGTGGATTRHPQQPAQAQPQQAVNKAGAQQQKPTSTAQQAQITAQQKQNPPAPVVGSKTQQSVNINKVKKVDPNQMKNEFLENVGPEIENRGGLCSLAELQSLTLVKKYFDFVVFNSKGSNNTSKGDNSAAALSSSKAMLKAVFDENGEYFSLLKAPDGGELVATAAAYDSGLVTLDRKQRARLAEPTSSKWLQWKKQYYPPKFAGSKPTSGGGAEDHAASKDEDIKGKMKDDITSTTRDRERDRENKRHESKDRKHGDRDRKHGVARSRSPRSRARNTRGRGRNSRSRSRRGGGRKRARSRSASSRRHNSRSSSRGAGRRKKEQKKAPKESIFKEKQDVVAEQNQKKTEGGLSGGGPGGVSAVASGGMVPVGGVILPPPHARQPLALPPSSTGRVVTQHPPQEHQPALKAPVPKAGPGALAIVPVATLTSCNVVKKAPPKNTTVVGGTHVEDDEYGWGDAEAALDDHGDGANADVGEDDYNPFAAPELEDEEGNEHGHGRGSKATVGDLMGEAGARLNIDEIDVSADLAKIPPPPEMEVVDFKKIAEDVRNNAQVLDDEDDVQVIGERNAPGPIDLEMDEGGTTTGKTAGVLDSRPGTRMLRKFDVLDKTKPTPVDRELEKQQLLAYRKKQLLSSQQQGQQQGNKNSPGAGGPTSGPEVVEEKTGEQTSNTAGTTFPEPDFAQMGVAAAGNPSGANVPSSTTSTGREQGVAASTSTSSGPDKNSGNQTIQQMQAQMASMMQSMQAMMQQQNLNKNLNQNSLMMRNLAGQMHNLQQQQQGAGQVGGQLHGPSTTSGVVTTTTSTTSGAVGVGGVGNHAGGQGSLIPGNQMSANQAQPAAQTLSNLRVGPGGTFRGGGGAASISTGKNGTQRLAPAGGGGSGHYNNFVNRGGSDNRGGGDRGGYNNSRDQNTKGGGGKSNSKGGGKSGGGSSGGKSGSSSGGKKGGGKSGSGKSKGGSSTRR